MQIDVNSTDSGSTLPARECRQISAWFRRRPGSDLLKMERAVLARILPGLFGYHIIQIGRTGGTELLESSRIAHKEIFELQDGLLEEGVSSLVCTADALPIAADSVDVVVLPHVLEFAPSAHRVLREVERVLIGDGHVVLLGFNPWSLWGLWRLFLGWRDQVPWCGHFYGLSRIRDWLALLDLELLNIERIFFRPPLRHGRTLDRIQVMEQLGYHIWPMFGGVYLLLARKRVVPLTPMKMRWRTRRSMIASGIAEPSARSRVRSL